MSAPSTDRQHWSRFAREWIAWARTPNHDAFWAYRDSLLEFVGRGNGDALDVGCGEGRVSRELKALGYKVTACDPTAEFIEAARNSTRPMTTSSQPQPTSRSKQATSTWSSPTTC